MLLWQWMAEAGAQGALARIKPSLRDVQFFAFGEHYYVRLFKGVSLQDNDLERLLQTMRDEFTAHNTTVTLQQTKPGWQAAAYLAPDPRIESTGATRSDPLGQRSKTELRVYPVTMTSSPPEQRQCDDDFIATVYARVTAYNLTGDWATFAKENL